MPHSSFIIAVVATPKISPQKVTSWYHYLGRRRRRRRVKRKRISERNTEEYQIYKGEQKKGFPTKVHANFTKKVSFPK